MWTSRKDTGENGTDREGQAKVGGLPDHTKICTLTVNLRFYLKKGILPGKQARMGKGSFSPLCSTGCRDGEGDEGDTSGLRNVPVAGSKTSG